MNKECFPFRPLLTERLLRGTPLPQELSRHLDQCPDCAREAAETDEVVRTLRRADPLADWTGARKPPARTRPSCDVSDRIRRIVAESKPAARPRYRRRIEVPVVPSGLKKGQTYRMTTVNAEGSRMPGGSVRADSHSGVSTHRVTAMCRDTITASLVEDESGHVMTHIPVPPPSPPASRPA